MIKKFLEFINENSSSIEEFNYSKIRSMLGPPNYLDSFETNTNVDKWILKGNENSGSFLTIDNNEIILIDNDEILMSEPLNIDKQTLSELIMKAIHIRDEK